MEPPLEAHRDLVRELQNGRARYSTAHMVHSDTRYYAGIGVYISGCA